MKNKQIAKTDSEQSEKSMHNNREHEHSHAKPEIKTSLIKILISSILFSVAFILEHFIIKAEISYEKLFANYNPVELLIIILYLLSYIICGIEVIKEALTNIFHLELLDECFLMTLATIGAIAISKPSEAAAVMILFQIGELFQSIAVGKSRDSITDLLSLKPESVTIRVDSNETKSVLPEDVHIGDIMLINPGERIPLDGYIIAGASSIDTSMLTGESLPVDVTESDIILSGSINLSGLLTVKVTKEYTDSTANRILKLVEDSSLNKSKSENFIHKFAQIYTPVVTGCAIILALICPLLFKDELLSTLANYKIWLERAFSFLVISCPCSLVISVPLSYFAGIGAASKQGILIKGSNYLEALSNANIIVWDKTGTLTEGSFSIESINNTINKSDFMKYLVHIEAYSSHPIAKSILNSYQGTIDESSIENYKVLPGYGIQADIFSKKCLAGNKRLLTENNIKIPFEIPDDKTAIYLSIDNTFAGYVLLADRLKADSKDTIHQLNSLGIEKQIMLTGDTKNIAESIAKALDLNSVYSQLLPTDKVAYYNKFKQDMQNKTIVFVGDGMNDAPVISLADIGISLGAYGNDAAISAADIVIMTDSVNKVCSALKIARKTHIIAIENIIFSIIVKLIILFLITIGCSNMYLAIFADVGVCIIAILNAIRALK